MMMNKTEIKLNQIEYTGNNEILLNIALQNPIINEMINAIDFIPQKIVNDIIMSNFDFDCFMDLIRDDLYVNLNEYMKKCFNKLNNEFSERTINLYYD